MYVDGKDMVPWEVMTQEKDGIRGRVKYLHKEKEWVRCGGAHL